MKRVEVEVLLVPEAEREFSKIQEEGRSLMAEWARRYLEDLTLFPPEEWVDLYHRLEGDVFKSDNHVPFDIQGKVLFDKHQQMETVIVTRFRSRNPA